jgi:hypothetical protein
MLANVTLPESVPQTSPKIKSAHERMLDGFTLVLRGSDSYFREIDAQVDRALARQNGAR